MPVFKYVCRACGEEFEALCMRDDEKAACPACDSQDLKKKVSRVGNAPGMCIEPSTGGGG